MSERAMDPLDLDAMRQQWAEHDRKLDTAIRLNHELLAARQLDRTRSALRRQTVSLSFELAVNAIAVLLLGNFVHANFGAIGFLWPGLHLMLLSVLIEIDLARQLAGIAAIDYRQPLPVVQRQLERLRVMAIRHVQGILLFAVLAWTPLLIVALRVIGIDAYQALGMRYLLANVVVGAAIVPLGFWLSRRFGERMGSHPAVQALMRGIAGTHLESARTFLAELEEMERA